MGDGGVIMLSFTMGSKLSCYQLKIDCYRYKLLCVSLMVTTKQKPIVNTQRERERTISIPVKKDIKSQMKKAREDRSREEL